MGPSVNWNKQTEKSEAEASGEALEIGREMWLAAEAAAEYKKKKAPQNSGKARGRENQVHEGAHMNQFFNPLKYYSITHIRVKYKLICNNTRKVWLWD